MKPAIKTLAADSIRALRKSRGWSTRQLGEAVGVSHRTVEHWEQGRPVSRLAALALARLADPQ